jgi:DNA (cytosine-5)-methyltransferase 1
LDKGANISGSVSYKMSSTANGDRKSVPLTFVDIFCGCGGFTLGLLRAGLHCLAAIDFEPHAIAALKSNLVAKKHPRLRAPVHVLEKDLTVFRPDALARLIGTDSVDVVVGGPPCQGFSTARQVDGANHGDRLKEDARRHLYKYFLHYVDFFQPKVFVMENVLGLRTAAGGEYFTLVQSKARILGQAAGHPGYRVQAQIEDAWDLGVPQKRRRQLIIGVRNDLPGYFPSTLPPTSSATPNISLGATICDLPRLSSGSGEDSRDYDLKRREEHINKYGLDARNYLSKVLEVELAEKLTNHVSRPHSSRDLRDFGLLHEGENSATAMRDRGVEFEFPYDKTSFKDRYTRQSRKAACSTIVAHLAKDGLMFIHPTQLRTLTPREAARVQSFPDWFTFPKARTHAFRLIGNAVPPLVGEAVGMEVTKFLLHTLPALRGRTQIAATIRSRIPNSAEEAAAILAPFAGATKSICSSSNNSTLLSAWFSLMFLMPGLHPDSALDHGENTERWANSEQLFPHLPPGMRSTYVRSGWPLAFVELAREMWKRRRKGEFREHEFYCVDAQRAGLEQRSEANL